MHCSRVPRLYRRLFFPIFGDLKSCVENVMQDCLPVPPLGMIGIGSRCLQTQITRKLLNVPSALTGTTISLPRSVSAYSRA